MRNDKLASKNIRFFLVPFLSLTILFALLAYNLTINHVQETYKRIEQSALSVAKSYSSSLETSSDAAQIITELLEEKIILASESVLLADSLEDNLELKRLAEKFQVDQINLFNSDGVVMQSNIAEYVGWKALPDHPVFNFMTGSQDALVEEIREDTESGVLYKFGYVKRKDNTFVQIGVRADNFNNILQKFDIDTFIQNIPDSENVEQVFFSDLDNELVAGSNVEYAERFIEDKHFDDHINLNHAQADRLEFENRDILHVCVPVYFENERIGTLTFIWSADIVDAEIIDIVFNSLVQFIIVIITIAIILSYAYRKSVSNIRIAYYDKLTGLPNREYLEEYLEQEIGETGRKKLAIFMLNCTSFKTVNITYGFRYGNQILKQIAKKLQSGLTPDDMLFRFGADRFVLVVEGYADRNALKKVAGSMMDMFSQPFGNGVRRETINAGIAVYELHGQELSVDRILQDVSLAMTYLRHDTNEQIIYYDSEMEIIAQRQDAIEKAIRALIEGENPDSLFLEFQPKLDLRKNTIIGFEALARLEVPGLGVVPPLEFIALSEKRMLMYELGRLILHKSCDFLNRLKNTGFDDISVAVNISGIQLLRDNFNDDVKDIIDAAGINIRMLEFEITESLLIDNFDRMNQMLKEIKKQGISISLDDFGTGFSSFARLRDLNIDSIKIDKYFIDKISVTEEAGLISADIISMAHKIGLTIVAEGVENEMQKEYLSKSNCDVIQGYLISRPLDQDAAIELLDKWQN